MFPWTSFYPNYSLSFDALRLKGGWPGEAMLSTSAWTSNNWGKRHRDVEHCRALPTRQTARPGFHLRGCQLEEDQTVSRVQKDPTGVHRQTRWLPHRHRLMTHGHVHVVYVYTFMQLIIPSFLFCPKYIYGSHMTLTESITADTTTILHVTSYFDLIGSYLRSGVSTRLLCCW